MKTGVSDYTSAVNKIDGKLKTASNGAGMLSQGANQLKESTSGLEAQSTQLLSGATDVNNALKGIHSGSSTVTTGLSDLYSVATSDSEKSRLQRYSLE